MSLPVEQVYEGLQAGVAYSSDSLDVAESEEDRQAYHPGWLAEVDGDLHLVDDRQALYQALSCLPDREMSVLLLRFYGNMTQTQIAQRLDMSPMQVSRLLTRTVSHLHDVFFGLAAERNDD